jgi:peroxiredoxin
MTFGLGSATYFVRIRCIMHSLLSQRKPVLSRWIKRFSLSAAAVLLVLVVVCADEPAATDLRLPDLDGRQVEPLRSKDAKAIVFIFIRTDCPISNRYAPELRRLHDKFTSSGVRFWLVYPDSDESVDIIRSHTKDYRYQVSALRDPDHKLVKLTGAQVTPEAAVFAPGGRMVYRGRIDDRYVTFGKTRPGPTTRDLEQVLEDLLEGKQITNRTTVAIGCFIPDL